MVGGVNRLGAAILGLCLALALAVTGLGVSTGTVQAQAGDDPTATPAGGAAAPVPSPTPQSTGEEEPPLTLLVPDLVTVAVDDLRLEFDANSGRRVMRFSNTIGNIGTGVIELVGQPSAQPGRYRVSQRLYCSDGQVLVEPIVEEIIYHAGHAHCHLASFASYELWRATPDGRLLDTVRVRGKISYCLFDHRPAPDTPPSRTYGTCEPELQGISPGWTDTYAAHVEDQWVDLTGLDNGVYVLRSMVNPRGVLRERTRENNDFLIAFRLEGAKVTQIPVHSEPWSLLRPHPGDQ